MDLSNSTQSAKRQVEEVDTEKVAHLTPSAKKAKIAVPQKDANTAPISEASCHKCQQVKRRDKFSKKVFRLDDERRVCWDCMNIPEELKLCHDCHTLKNRSYFWTEQWEACDACDRRCQQCHAKSRQGNARKDAKAGPPTPGASGIAQINVASDVPTSKISTKSKRTSIEETKLCDGCDTLQSRSNFSKGQWKKDNNKGWWDKRYRTCIDCVANKVDVNALKNAKRFKFSDASSHPDYYNMGGIAVEPIVQKNYECSVDGFQRKDFVGSYDMVYYYSVRECGCHEDETEHISRAVGGKLELEETKWNGKSALCGRFHVDAKGDGWSSGKASTKGSIVELVHGDRCFEEVLNAFEEYQGGQVSSEDEIEEEGEGDDEEAEDNGSDVETTNFQLEHFAGVRVYTKGVWWHLGMEDDGDEYFFEVTKLGFLEDDLALGLQSDYPVPASSKIAPPVTMGELPTDTAHGKAMLKKFQDGSNSWLINHFSMLDPMSAAKIREYVTPPPVLLLKKGDLVMEILETFGPECEKVIVFRKKQPKDD
jgi:Stc1 domain